LAAKQCSAIVDKERFECQTPFDTASFLMGAGVVSGCQRRWILILFEPSLPFEIENMTNLRLACVGLWLLLKNANKIRLYHGQQPTKAFVKIIFSYGGFYKV